MLGFGACAELTLRGTVGCRFEETFPLALRLQELDDAATG